MSFTPSAAAQAAKVAADAALKATPTGIDPGLLAYMQQQERIRQEERQERAEERAYMERNRKDDKELAEQERHAQNRSHQLQLEMLQKQLDLANNHSHTHSRSSSKMPMFDVDKDQETFHLWQNRWKLHLQGHSLNTIANPDERKNRILMELTASLSDSTLAWLASKNFDEGELENHKFILQALEDKINCSSNPLVHQIELANIVQHAHEEADSLIQRIQVKANKCHFKTIKNFHEHQSMITLIKAVTPEVRKKMLLQKVKTFQEACDVLKNEEQALADTKKCSQNQSQMQEAEGNAISGYKRDQKTQHSEKFDRPPKESL